MIDDENVGLLEVTFKTASMALLVPAIVKLRSALKHAIVAAGSSEEQRKRDSASNLSTAPRSALTATMHPFSGPQ